MLISLALILSVAFFDVPAWALFLLFLTWLPDIIITAIILFRRID